MVAVAVAAVVVLLLLLRMLLWLLLLLWGILHLLLCVLWIPCRALCGRRHGTCRCVPLLLLLLLLRGRHVASLATTLPTVRLLCRCGLAPILRTPFLAHGPPQRGCGLFVSCVGAVGLRLWEKKKSLLRGATSARGGCCVVERPVGWGSEGGGEGGGGWCTTVE